VKTASNLAWVLLAIALSVISAGCAKSTASAGVPRPLEVGVAETAQRDVPLYKEWIGTLDGLDNADIKAQVSGYLVRQGYKEGSFVHKGQLLFQIDPRPFQAALDQANGQLAETQGQLTQARAHLVQVQAEVSVAEANQGRTQLDVNRYSPLVQQEAVSQEDLDNATQNNMAAKAQVQSAQAQVETARAQIIATEAAVQAAKAAVENARINLDFSHLVSPIDGIPGIAQLQVGALVSPASGAITTVSTLDPIKVYFTPSEQEYLEYTRRFPTAEERQESHKRMELELILADGATYAHKGTFDFANRQVDVRTGAIRLAALFPNPGNILRPGQYGRVRAAIDIQRGALLVPQQAIFDLQGTHEVAVLDGGNRVSVRAVTLGDTVGHQWIVRDGVHPGERVIVDGVQKVRTGMIVTPKLVQVK